MMAKNRSLRTNLVFLVAACMVPVTLAAASFVYADYRSERARLLASAQREAHVLMDSVDDEFRQLEVSLHSLSTSPLLAAQDYAGFRRQAEHWLERHYADNIVLVDASGQLYLSTARPAREVLAKIADVGIRQRVVDVIATGRSNVSSLFSGPVTKKPVVLVMVAIQNYGSVPDAAGVPLRFALGGVKQPAHIQKILVDQKLPSAWTASVIDGNGVLVARSSGIEQNLGKSVSSDIAQQLALLQAGGEASFESVTREGVPVLLVAVRSRYSDWSAAIGVPKASLAQQLWQSVAYVVSVLVLIVLFSVGAAWWMGGRLTQTVARLRDAAAVLGRAPVIDVPALKFSEAREVGQSIERVSAEMAASARSLQESETRLRRILESAKDAIVTFDDDHRIVMFNGTASVMFACPPAQAVGMRVTEFMPQRVRAQHHLNVERFRVVGEAFGYNVGLRRSGQEFPVEVSYSNVVEGQGVLHTMIIRDITARKANLDALKRSNQDLQQFAFVASHDLKTPLRSISGFVQMLDRKYADRLDDEARSLISRTQNATVRLEQLTDDLLAYAQVNHNPAPFVRVELQSVMQEVMQLQHVALLETGAQLTVGVLPAVMGERTQLIQLFSNLLANSLKYCQNLPPTVHITASPGANFWTVHVQDNGIGIEEKHFAKIFDVFKRLHTQQEYAGTGIGLALCKRVAEHHGGSISVTSAPGAGSTFDVSFPKVPESLNTEERAA